MERVGLTLDEAGFATSLYFIFRTAGCLLGTFILQHLSARRFLGISVVCMLVAMAGLLVSDAHHVIYVCIALIGFGNSNVFPIIFAQALTAVPDKKNEVSGLMIMGLFGGTIFPLLMGMASDAVGQSGAVAVMTIGVLYLIAYTLKMKSQKTIAMNNQSIVVGMGEALWDVLPEGKNWVEHPPILPITYRSSDWKAA